jgi:hypothetical protein
MLSEYRQKNPLKYYTPPYPVLIGLEFMNYVGWILCHITSNAMARCSLAAVFMFASIR